MIELSSVRLGAAILQSFFLYISSHLNLTVPSFSVCGLATWAGCRDFLLLFVVVYRCLT